MSEPARIEPSRAQLDVRVGSATNALQPISGAARSLAAGAAQWVGLALVAVAAACADQLTKRLVSGALDLGDAVEIVGPFSIHHVQNTGIAFGLFSDSTSVVIALTAVAVGCMLVFFARSGARHPCFRSRSASCSAGASSNLVDRLRLGHVTDFLDLDYWPAFNLADTFIVVGVGLLFALVRGRPTGRARTVGDVTALASLSRTRAGASTPSSPTLPEVGSRALAERLVTGGAVLVDGQRRPKSHRLAGGEERRGRAPGRAESSRRSSWRSTVVYEDEHLLVVDKPAGLVVHPAGAGDARDARRTGCSRLGAAGGDPERPGIVHRLDRDTSGLLVVARSAEAHERLSEADPASGEVERRYLALVRGRPRSRTGRIDGSDRPRSARPDTALARHRRRRARR